MRFYCSFLSALFAFATVLTTASAQKADPAVYGALPTVSAAEISPDGKTIAQLQSKDGVRAIAFYDLSGKAPPIGVELGDVNSRLLQWAGPNHVIVMVSASKTFGWGHGLETHEIWRWISVNRQTGEFSYLFDGANRFNFYSGTGRVHSTLPNEPNRILMGHYSRRGEYSLYRINLTTGKEALSTKGSREDWYAPSEFVGTVDWVVDAAGEPAVRIGYDLDNEERLFFKPADNHEGWTLASAIPEKEEEDISVIAHGLAGARNLIHATMTVDGYRGLHIFDIDQGKISEPVFSAKNYDIDDAVVDPSTAAVIGVQYVDDFRRTHFILPAFNQIQKKLETALSGANPKITSWSDDFSKFMVRVSYSDHPDQFFLYEQEKKSLVMTAPSYADLDGKVRAEKERFDYVSSDGSNIRGYLTMPAGAEKAALPLIVLPHGGPWARDDQSFEWWSFFYAARGYLVYQPNFRGSAGYGKGFKEAGNGEWGRKMQDDITEGVQKLITNGLVDQDRICIVGGSYGGYAALAGATLTPDLYACAVSVNGVSNVLQLLADASGRDPENEYWKERVGSRFSDNDSLRQISPLYHISSATPPIMLIHAEHDIVVPEGQSRRMRNALRDKGKEHEFVLLKGEDHWLSTGEMRTEMLRASIDFIDRYIGE